jgi:hypothetical protein
VKRGDTILSALCLLKATGSDLLSTGTHVLVKLEGPGVFLGAAISKQGGANGLTFLVLDLDGRKVTNLSYAGAENSGLRQQNPYGLVLLKSKSLKTFTVGLPAPLRFERELKLSVTVNETSVVADPRPRQPGKRLAGSGGSYVHPLHLGCARRRSVPDSAFVEKELSLPDRHQNPWWREEGISVNHQTQGNP